MKEGKEVSELTESLRKYVNANCELLKLEATERTSGIGSRLMSHLIIVLAEILFIFFISLAAGFYISMRLGDNYSGFIVVAGTYSLLAITLITGRKKLLEKPLRDKIIKQLLSKN